MKNIVFKVMGFLLLFPAVVSAETAETQQLLAGEILAESGKADVFLLEGESRDKVVGGTLTVGEKTFVIEKVSVHRLVGARNDTESITEFAVFSSSYSEQVATGKPWVAATTTHHCDKPYNSFLGLYTISDAGKRTQLGKVPYPKLIAAADASDQSVVYCFMAKPPQ